MNRFLPLLLLILIPVVPAQAFDLPDAFDEPCVGGMGILADICNAINDIHDFVHGQEVRINSLNSTQIAQQVEIVDIQGNLTNAKFNILTLEGNVTSHFALITDHHFEANMTGLQSDMTAVEEELDLLPLIHYAILQDSNDPDCEDGAEGTPLGIALGLGWCPIEDQLLPLVFNITDSRIISNSTVIASIVPFSLTCPERITVADGSFQFACNNEKEDAVLRYIIITPQ